MARSFTYENKSILQRGIVLLAPWATKEIEEIFTEERDKELNRWRSKDDPNFVGYPTSEGNLMLFDEITGETHWFTHKLAKESSGKSATIAIEYFFEKTQKVPGYNAKLGDVWVVTWRGMTSACTVHEFTASASGFGFQPVDRPSDMLDIWAYSITEAKLIWDSDNVVPI